MRPVNLIPPEEQGVGSGRGPLRTGPAAYIIVGALALGLVMVIAMAITSKQIDDQTAKKTTLEPSWRPRPPAPRACGPSPTSATSRRRAHRPCRASPRAASTGSACSASSR